MCLSQLGAECSSTNGHRWGLACLLGDQLGRRRRTSHRWSAGARRDSGVTSRLDSSPACGGPLRAGICGPVCAACLSRVGLMSNCLRVWRPMESYWMALRCDVLSVSERLRGCVAIWRMVRCSPWCFVGSCGTCGRVSRWGWLALAAWGGSRACLLSTDRSNYGWGARPSSLRVTPLRGRFICSGSLL